MFCIELAKTNDIPLVEKLLDEAFGLDRFEKTAYRLRDGVEQIWDLAFVVRGEEGLLATLQFWPIVVGEGPDRQEALLLGPIAVCDSCRGKGAGRALMVKGLDKAREMGYQRVILVGDEDYYKKVGFSRSLAEGLEMPGPVDKNRLLAHALVPGGMDGVQGMICKSTDIVK
ncbi:GNAT family N-acetyltransferase [Paremcibacter congregatus]|uniref:GNAT family N-acetyltransferase n=1 Tax=Paremcibacter congregatus TaxID=2043170 RepID=UPI003A904963